MKAAPSPLPPVQPVRWDRHTAKLLLKRPKRLLADAQIQVWLQQRGGLAAVRTFLEATALTEPQRRLLTLLFQKPGDSADLHAEELGVHRATYFRWLDDLSMVLADALTVWEVDASPAVLPAIFGSAPGLRHQLPAPSSDFVGRTTEIQHLREALQVAPQAGASATSASIHGMAGIGKTELAYQVAHSLRDAFPDAQIVLTLRGASTTPLTPDEALRSVIRALTPDAQLSDDADELVRQYRSALHEQRVLILADDARDAAQVRPLVPPSGCALLITSRQRFMLPGMAPIDLDLLPAGAASTLLQTICPRLAKDEAQALAQVCDYLPLALRVSGGVLHNNPALSITAYLAKLADERERLAYLRDPDDEQLDVPAALTLSYAQLDAASQAVFRQLGIFVTNFTTELALAVVDAPATTETAAALHLLLRRNLVMYEALRGRWRLHDLLRDLGRHYLEAAGEYEATRWRYAHAAVQSAQEIHDGFLAEGTALMESLARFDAERPHIDTARAWGIAHAGRPDGDQLLLAMTLATMHPDELRSDATRERIPQLERALGAAHRLGERPAEGQILLSLGRAVYDLGMLQRAIPCWQQALDTFQQLGDPHSEARTLGNLGTAYARLGELPRAIPAYEQALALFRALGDRRYVGHALGNLGAAYAELREEGKATPCLDEAMAYARAVGDRRFEACLLQVASDLACASGESQRALTACADALAITREIGDRRQEGYTLSALGCAYAALGDLASAITIFDEALAVLRDAGDRWGAATCGWHYGQALARQGDYERGMPLLRASAAYMAEIGHAQAETHKALLARLEQGEELAPELSHSMTQRTVGADAETTI